WDLELPAISGLIAGRLSVLPAFARADVNTLAVVHLHFNRLISAVTAEVEADIVAFLFQFARGLERHAALEIHVAAGLRQLFAGWFAIAFVLPARGVAGFLNRHAEIDLVREDLNVTLRLHSAAHHAERFPWFAILHHESRNDRVERPFARRVNVRVAGLHRK